jgi:hypothetical protein
VAKDHWKSLAGLRHVHLDTVGPDEAVLDFAHRVNLEEILRQQSYRSQRAEAQILQLTILRTPPYASGSNRLNARLMRTVTNLEGRR